jgi:hypothetical protein
VLVNERLSAPCYRPQTLASNLAKSHKFRSEKSPEQHLDKLRQNADFHKVATHAKNRGMLINRVIDEYLKVLEERFPSALGVHS